MGEKSDFYIEKVRYSQDRLRIICVSVREDSGTKLSKAYDMQRENMIDQIQKGKNFLTIFRNPAGKFRKGQAVYMAEVNGKNYLRTDDHNEKIDQLEHLPEY